MMQVKRKAGLAGELEDKVTTDFMKLMDIMESQRSTKVSERAFRESYRKQSLTTGKHQYSRTTLINPAMTEVKPSKTNILGSSSTFRLLSAQKLQRHTASALNMRRKLQQANGAAGIATSSDYGGMVAPSTAAEQRPRSTRMPHVAAHHATLNSMSQTASCNSSSRGIKPFTTP